MERLLNFTIDEYKKLFSQAWTKVVMALSVAFVITVGLIGFYIDDNTRIHLVAPGEFPLLVLKLITGFVLPALAIFIASELLTSEFKDGTIKNLFALPVSKGIIYLGKMIAGVAALGTFLIAISVSSMVASTVINGFAAFGNMGGFIVSYIGIFIFLAMVLVITSLFSLFAGSPGMAIVMNLLLWLVLGTIGTLVPATERFLPTSFIGWYRPLISGANVIAVLYPLLFMLSYCVVFTVAGIMVFDKKEV
jgi:Predicted membrane protein